MNELVEYNGHKVTIHNAQILSNPLEDQEFYDYVMVNFGDMVRSYDSFDIVEYLDFVTDEDSYSKNLGGLIEILDINLSEYVFDHTEFKYDNHKGHLLSVIEDKYKEDIYTLHRVLDELNVSHKFETSRGHNQGECAQVLVLPRNLDELMDMDATLKVFSAWAWGNVYYYTIEGIETEQYNYYGFNHEDSGLLEDARQVIDTHISNDTKKRYNRLKQLIKHRVPLNTRNEILNKG